MESVLSVYNDPGVPEFAASASLQRKRRTGNDQMRANENNIPNTLPNVPKQLLNNNMGQATTAHIGLLGRTGVTGNKKSKYLKSITSKRDI